MNVIAHMLAGKDTDGPKIRDAGKRNVVVVSLGRLQRLLRGDLTHVTLKDLPLLTRESLKGDAYDREAGTTQPAPAASLQHHRQQQLCQHCQLCRYQYQQNN